MYKIATVPMVGMFDTGLRTAVLGGNYDTGRALANAKLEEVRALDFLVIEDRYRPSGSPHRPASVNGFDFEITTSYCDRSLDTCGNSPRTSYMKVDVKVSWDGGDKEYNTAGVKVRS